MAHLYKPHRRDGEKAPSAQAAPGSNTFTQPTRSSSERSLADTSDRFVPVTHWNQRHAWPPIGGLRHLIFNAKSNGFDKVIRRVGRRVLIDEHAFFAWVNRNVSVE